MQHHPSPVALFRMCCGKLSEYESFYSCHTKTTQTARPVLVLHKKPIKKKWLEWKKRENDAVPRLRQLIQACLDGVVDSHEMEKWLSLAFLNHRELEWIIPTYLCIPQKVPKIDRTDKQFYGLIISNVKFGMGSTEESQRMVRAATARYDSSGVKVVFPKEWGQRSY